MKKFYISFLFLLLGIVGFAQEIDVTGKNISIPSGSASTTRKNDTYFGETVSTPVGGVATISKVFTIANTGTKTLSIGTVTATGDYSITVQPAATVIPKGYTTFTVQFDPSSNATLTSTITIPNNDADEGTYTFTVGGLGIASRTARYVHPSNADPGTVSLQGTTYNTAGGPYTTIAAAIAAAGAYDIVYVADATYTNPTKDVSTNCGIGGVNPGQQELTFYIDVNKANIIISSATGNYLTSAAILDGYAFNIITTGGNVTIQGFDMQNIQVNGFWNSNCCGYGPTSDVKILNNHINNTHGHGIKTDSGFGSYVDRGAWEISGNRFTNIGDYLGTSNGCTPGPVSAIWLAEPGDSYVISNNIIDDSNWAGILCDGYANGAGTGAVTISGNTVSNTEDAGIQIGFSSNAFYTPTNAFITDNVITNANTSSKVGIGAITILQSNVAGVRVLRNDVTSSFNGVAIEIAGWAASPDITYVNYNDIYSLSGGYGVTHIGGISPNGLFGTGDDLAQYNFDYNYWGDASGPTYTTNVGGTGEPLKKDANTLGGGTYSLNDFDFIPFNDTQGVFAPINNDPVVSVPSDVTTNPSTPVAISGASIVDLDGDAQEVTISTSKAGLIDVTLSGSATITGGADNSASVTISGSLADINTVLGSLQYDPNGVPGVHVITVASDDNSPQYNGPGSNSNTYNVLVTGNLVLTGTITGSDLKDAVDEANLVPGAGIIDLTGIATPASLTPALNPITETLTILGPGSGLLTLNGSSPAIPAVTTTGVDLTLSDMTLTGGTNINGGGIEFNPGAGGGKLTLTRVRIDGNTASASGGGIYFNSDGVGSSITQCTIINNTGPTGAGINIVRGTISITNSTIGNNVTGSGISVDGTNGGAVLLSHVTVSGNAAGGVVSTASGAIDFQYSIIYGKTGTEISAAMADIDFGSTDNVVGDTYAGGTYTNDTYVVTTDPVLSALTTNNDHTDGFIPSSIGSAANASVNGTVSTETIDQTGATRNGNRTLGAIEVAVPLPPTITNATWSDQNGDGNIDRVVLTFSVNVNAVDGNAGDGFGAILISNGGAITIDNANYAATNVGTLTLNFTGDQIIGTGISGLSVTYDDAGANSIVGNVGSLEIADAGISAAYTDSATPVISNFQYQDLDGDGMIDQIVVTFSEALDAASVLRANDLVFGNVGDFTAAAFGADVTDLITAGGTTSVTVVLGTESTAVDTGEDSGSIAITTQNLFSLFDGVNTNTTLGNQTQATFSDGAAPILVSSSPVDNATGVSLGANIVLTFSENIQAGTGDISVIDVASTDDRVITLPDGQLSFSTNQLTINLSTDLTTPNNNYAVNIAATAIDDQSVAANSYAGIADNTTLDFTTASQPTITNATWSDQNADGKIDRVVLTFSENVNIVDGNAGDGFGAILISNGGAITIDNANYAATNVGTLTLNFTGANQITGTGISGLSVTYDDAGANQIVGNVGGVEIADAAVASAYTDSATPVITNFQYQDLDGDGKIDQIVVSFSEALNAASVLRANDLVFGNVGDFTAAAFGADVTDLITAGGTTSVTVVLGTESTAVDTGENSGLIAITTQNLFSLFDGVNTNTTLGNQTQATFSDGAAPILVSSSPVDNATNVTLGTNIVLTFSENIQAGTGDISVIDLAGSDDRVITLPDAQLGFSTNQLTIDLSTDLTTPNNNYAVNIAATAIDDQSVAANSYAGIADNTTLDFTTATQPTITNATWSDQNGDGKIDRVVLTFSQNVNIVDGNAGDGFGAILISNGGAITIDNANYAATNVGTLTLNFTGANQITGTGISGLSVTYDDAGANSIVGNVGGVEIADAAVAAAYTDSATPVISNFQYQDLDSDGKIDQIVVTFSEALNAASVLRANDLVFGNVGDFTAAAFGAATTDLITAGGTTSVTVVLGTESSARDTRENSGSIAISTQNLFSLSDGVNTNTTLGNQAQATFSDGAAPIVNNLNISDTNNDAFIDQIVITFSETIDTDNSAAPVLADLGTLLLPDGTAIVTSGGLSISDPAGASSTVTITGISDQVTENTAVGLTAIDGLTGLWVDGSNNAIIATGDDSETLTDSANPILLSSTPPDGSISFPPSGNIILTFSENIQAGTGNVILRRITAGPSNLETFTIPSARLIFATNTLTIDPTADLILTNQYAIRVAATVVDDASGLALSYVGITNDTDLNFTANNTAPVTCAHDYTAPTGEDATANLSPSFCNDEPTFVSSLVDTQAEAVTVFYFNLLDGNNGTNVTSITIENGNTDIDWTNLIAGATLIDENGANQGSPTISANSLVFSSIPTTAGALGRLTSGQDKEYALSVWFNTNLGAEAIDIDGKSLIFQAGHGGMTGVAKILNPGGTAFTTSATDRVSSGSITFNVVATDYKFLQQPSTTQANVIMTPAVTLEAVDVNGNRDLGYNGADPVQITSTGTLSTLFTPSPPVAGTWASGVSTVSNVIHTVAQAGRALGTTSGALTNAPASSTFTVSADATKPTFVAGHFFDTNADGTIDEIVIEMNEEVNEASAAFGNFTVATGTITGVLLSGPAVNTLDASDADQYVTLQVSVPGTTTQTLSYTAGTLADPAGNTALSNASITQVDKAGPAIISATIRDTETTPDGFIDRVDLVFSENFTQVGTVLPSDFTFGSGYTASGVTVGTNTIQITLNEMGSRDTYVRPTLTIAAGIIQDAALQANLLKAFGQVSDGAAPFVAVNTLSTADLSPPLSGTIDDPTASVIVTVGGFSRVATNNGVGGWTLADNSFTLSSVGTYDVSVLAFDSFGNSGYDATTNELTITGGIAITGATFNECIDAGYFPLGQIRMLESSNGDFASSGTLLLTLPEGFEFNTAIAPTFGASTLVDIAVTSTFIGTASVRLTITRTGATGIDDLRIDNLMVRAIGSTGWTNQKLTRTGGTISLNTTATDYADLSSQAVEPALTNALDPSNNPITQYIAKYVGSVNVPYTPLLGLFTDGEQLNFSGGAIGRMVPGSNVVGVTFRVYLTSGTTIAANETVTGASSGATATVNAAPTSAAAYLVPFTLSVNPGAYSAVWRNAVTSAIVNSDSDATNTELGATAPGLYSYDITIDNGMCENDPFRLNVLIYNDLDVATFATSTLVNRAFLTTTPTSQLYVSNPAGYTTSLTGTATSVTNSASTSWTVNFSPSFAGVGIHPITYKVTNSLNEQISITVNYTVTLPAEFFEEINMPADVCAADLPYTLTIDNTAFQPGQDLYYVLFANNTYVNPVPVDPAMSDYYDYWYRINYEFPGYTGNPATSVYDFDFDPRPINTDPFTQWPNFQGITYNGFDIPDGGAVALYVRRTLQNPYVEPFDYLYIYGTPIVSLENLGAFYCPDELPFTIQRQADYVSGFSDKGGSGNWGGTLWEPIYESTAIENITTGYLLYTESVPGSGTYDVLVEDYTGADANGTGMVLTNTFNPSDPDGDTNTAEDESGNYRIVYTTESLTPAGCAGTASFDFVIYPKPTEPVLNLATLSYGGAIGFVNTDEYLLEYCQGSVLNLGDVQVTDTGNGETISWYKDANNDGNPDASPFHTGFTVPVGNAANGIGFLRTASSNRLTSEQTISIWISQSIDGCESDLREITLKSYLPGSTPVFDRTVNSWPATVQSGNTYFLDYQQPYGGSLDPYDHPLTPALNSDEAYSTIRKYVGFEEWGFGLAPTQLYYAQLAGITGTFVKGELVVGGVSGATGRVHEYSGGNLTLRQVTGTFGLEGITGATSTATATIIQRRDRTISTGSNVVVPTIDDIQYIYIGTVSLPFRSGETITGASTGSTAIVVNVSPYFSNYYLVIRQVSGAFFNENITGSVSGAAAFIYQNYPASTYYYDEITKIDNINSASNFSGCEGTPIYLYSYAWPTPSDVSVNDMSTYTFDYHVSEGVALTSIGHNYNVERYTWYENSNKTGQIAQLSNGQSMTQSTLSALSTIGKKFQISGTNLAIDYGNDDLNDLYTYYVSRTQNIISSRGFNGSESVGTVPINITVHAKQPQPVIVSDNSSNISISDFVDQGSGTGFDHSYAICSDQIANDLQFDGSETVYPSNYPAGSREFRWYSYNFGSSTRGALLYTGTDADFVSLQLSSLSGVASTTTRYFEVVQVTDILAGVYAGSESDNAIVQVSVYPQSDLVFNGISNGANYCVDDLGTDGMGNRELVMNSEGSAASAALLSYDIVSGPTVQNYSGTGNPTLDLDVLHIAAGGDADLIGGVTTTHQITMYYIQPNGNCLVSNTATISVVPLPDITFYVNGIDITNVNFAADYDEFCYDDASFSLEGVFSDGSVLTRAVGGSFEVSINGSAYNALTTTNNKASFNPKAQHDAAAGGVNAFKARSTQDIRFTYTDALNCENTVSTTIYIDPRQQAQGTVNSNQIKFDQICKPSDALGGSESNTIAYINLFDPGTTNVVSDYSNYSFDWTVNGNFVGSSPAGTNTIEFFESSSTLNFVVVVNEQDIPTPTDPLACELTITETHTKQDLPVLNYPEIATNDKFCSETANIQLSLTDGGMAVSDADVLYWAIYSYNDSDFIINTTVEDTDGGSFPEIDFELWHETAGGNTYANYGGVNKSVGGPSTSHFIVIEYRDPTRSYQSNASLCTNRYEEFITITPSTDIDISVNFLDDTAPSYTDHFCYDNGLVSLNGILNSDNTLLGFGQSGTWSGSGVTQQSQTSATWNPITANGSNPYTLNTSGTVVTFSYTDNNGCSQSVTKTLYVDPRPDPIEFFGAQQIEFLEICAGSPIVARVRIDDPSTGGLQDVDYADYTFAWSLPGDASGATYLDNQVTYNSSITNALPNKNFTIGVTITEIATGCSITISEVHTQQTLPTLTFNGIVNQYCQEDSDVQFTMNTNAGVIGVAGATDIDNLDYSVYSYRSDLGFASGSVIASGSGVNPTIDMSQWHIDAGGAALGGYHTVHVITMTYEDLTDNVYQGVNTECISIATATITIYPDADLSFTVDGTDRSNGAFIGNVSAGDLSADDFCYGDASVSLNGIFGPLTSALGYNIGLGTGSFSSTTVGAVSITGNNTALFNPTAAHNAFHGGGLNPHGARSAHTITYTFDDQFSCQNSVSAVLYVNPLPDPIEVVGGPEAGEQIKFSEICVESPKVAFVELVGVTDYTDYTFTWQMPFGASGVVDYSGARALDGSRRVSVTGDPTANEIQFNSTITNATANKLFSINVTITNNLTGCQFSIAENHEEQSLPVLSFQNISNGNQYCAEDTNIPVVMTTTTTGSGSTLTGQVIGVASYTDIADLSYSVTSYKADTPGTTMVRTGSGNPTIDMIDWHTNTIGGTLTGGEYTVHVITMTYRDDTDNDYQGLYTSCTNTSTATITIYPDPDLSFQVQKSLAASLIDVSDAPSYVGGAGDSSGDEICYDNGNVNLFGIFGSLTSGIIGDGISGTFAGPGVSIVQKNQGLFNPIIAHGVDPHKARTAYTITYSYTDKFGCFNEISKDIYVNPQPDPIEVVGGLEDGDQIKFSEICFGSDLVAHVDLLDPNTSNEIASYAGWTYVWDLPNDATILSGTFDDAARKIITVTGSNELTFKTSSKNFTIAVVITNPNTECSISLTEDHTQQDLPLVTINNITSTENICSEDDPRVITTTTDSGVVGVSASTLLSDLSWTITSYRADDLVNPTFTTAVPNVGTNPTLDFLALHLNANGSDVGGYHTEHVLSITYTDNTDPARFYQGNSPGCTKTSTVRFSVHPDPDMSFTINGDDFVRSPGLFVGNSNVGDDVSPYTDHFCYDDGNIALEGLFGLDTEEALHGYTHGLGTGSFSGPGVVGNGNNKGLFNPATAHGVDPYAPRSAHVITYTYTDQFGCLNTITKDVYVHPLPNPIEVVGGTEAGGQIRFSAICVESPITAYVALLDADTGLEVADYSNYTFTWTLPFGASGAAQNLNEVTYTSSRKDFEGNKTFSIEVLVTNNLTNCEFPIKEIHAEQSLPVLNFDNLSSTADNQYCSEDSDITVVMSTTTQDGANTNQIIGSDPFTDLANVSWTVTSYKWNTPGTTDIKTGVGSLPTIDMDAWHTTGTGATLVGGDHTVHIIEITYQDLVDNTYQTDLNGSTIYTACSKTVSATVLIYPDPDLSFTVGTSDIVRDGASYLGNDPGDVRLASDHFCYDEGNISLEGLFGPALDNIAEYNFASGVGTFSGDGVVGNGTNKGIFNPAVAHGPNPYAARSVHPVVFTYTDQYGCLNTISKDLYVNPLPRFENDTRPTIGQGRIQFTELCLGYVKNGFVNLVDDAGVLVSDFSNYEFQWVLPVGTTYGGAFTTDPQTGNVLVTISADNTISFDNDNLVFPVTVTAVNTLTGCSASITESETQGYPPIPTFTYTGLTAGGNLNVQLYQDNVSLNNSTMTYLLFRLLDVNLTEVTRIERFGNGFSAFDLSSATISGLPAGDYTTELVMQTIKGCDISAPVRTITILPLVIVSQSGYEENFESGNGGWYIERAGEDGKTDGTRISSWEITSEPGVTFNPDPSVAPYLDITTAYEGTGMVITNWDDAYLASEESYVYSPAYDLSAFIRPALSFWHWRDFDSSRDGLVVQISDDDGATWNELGDNDLTSGVNWYTNQGVSSGPGEEGRFPEVGSNPVGVGFADADRDPDTREAIVEWKESRHAISGVDLSNTVRFRFALAAGSGEKYTTKGLNIVAVADGFAFDFFQIYEKDKVVMVEQFSSTLSDASKANEKYIQTGVGINGDDHDYNWIVGDQGVWINYYTDFYNTSTAIDPINARNKVDPSTRATYYGVTDVPATRIGGDVVPYVIATNPEDFGNGFDAIALEDPDFRIPKGPAGLRFTSDPLVTDKIQVSATFISEVDRPDDVELGFYFAIVEKRIPAITTQGVMNGLDSPGGVYTASTDTLYHVLRQMVPGPAGNYYRGPLTVGQSFDFSIDWTISGIYNLDEIRVIAFVQYYNDPLKGNNVEQANFIDASGRTNVVTGIDDLLKQYNIYPNPSDDVFNIELAEVPQKDVYWKISDQSGREVLRGKIDRGTKAPIPVDSHRLPSGLYILQLTSEERTWMPKKVIISH